MHSSFLAPVTKRELRERAARLHPENQIISSERVARSTLAYTLDDGREIVLYHKTDILDFTRSGALSVNTGGFNSQSCRKRLNTFGRGALFHTHKNVIHCNGVPFKQKCFVRECGAVEPDVKKAELDELNGQIDAYLKAFKKRGLSGSCEGNPWFLCQTVSNTDMLDWVKSKYLFDSLYYWALEMAGVAEDEGQFLARRALRNGFTRIDISRLRQFIRATAGS